MLRAMSRGVSGVGIGFRPEIAHGLLKHPHAVDFLEVVAESAWARTDWRREVHALREVWMVVPHGVKLSLASADGIEEDKARRLGELARELRAPMISEHVALTRAGKREIGHLTAVPFTREAVKVVVRNVARARKHLPDVPLLLENIAWTLRWPDDEISEGEFHAEVARATGCDMLLDVANVYANARNSGVDPTALLETYPLDRVAMIHVAGGILEDGFYFDTHAHDMPGSVLDLLARAIERCGDVPIVLERDGNFPAFEHTLQELDAIRSIQGEAPSGIQGRAPLRALDGEPVTAWSESRSSSTSRLEEAQSALAEALLRGGPCDAFDPRAIARTRAVLCGKRIDDALPLLGRLSRRRAEVEPLVRSAVAEWPRPDTLVGPADAFRIADAALAEPALADDARWDRLLLRARFVGPNARGEVRPRVAPFVGHETIGGRRIWAWKGPGAGAPIRLRFSRADAAPKRGTS